MNTSRRRLGISLATALLGAGMTLVASSVIVGLGSGGASATMVPVHRGLPMPRIDAVVVSGSIGHRDSGTAALTRVRLTAGAVDITKTAPRTMEAAQGR